MWPVRIAGRECGTVSARRRGAYTEYALECADPGRPLRMSLFARGRELYLGVPAPDGRGRASLTRRFTRAELGSFPAEPEYAAEAGAGPSPEPRPQPAKPPTEPEPAAEGWRSSSDGTLTRREGGRLMVALPAADVRLPAWAAGIKRRIGAREYVVFPR